MQVAWEGKKCLSPPTWPGYKAGYDYYDAIEQYPVTYPFSMFMCCKCRRKCFYTFDVATSNFVFINKLSKNIHMHHFKIILCDSLKTAASTLTQNIVGNLFWFCAHIYVVCIMQSDLTLVASFQKLLNL